MPDKFLDKYRFHLHDYQNGTIAVTGPIFSRSVPPDGNIILVE